MDCWRASNDSIQNVDKWIQDERKAGRLVAVSEILDILTRRKCERDAAQADFAERKTTSRRYQLDRWQVKCNDDYMKLLDHLKICKRQWTSFLALENEHAYCPKSTAFASECVGCGRCVCAHSAICNTICQSIAVCDSCDTFTGDLNPYNPNNVDFLQDLECRLSDYQTLNWRDCLKTAAAAADDNDDDCYMDM